MKVYEDQAIIARLLEEGAVEGHLVVEPKHECNYLIDLPEGVAAHLYWCASFAATAVFETLNAQGTNILLVEGERLALHVLPRFENDGVGLMWEPKPGDQGELDQVSGIIADKLWYVGKSTDDSEVTAASTIVDENANEEDYRVKNLFRSP